MNKSQKIITNIIEKYNIPKWKVGKILGYKTQKDYRSEGLNQAIIKDKINIKKITLDRDYLKDLSIDIGEFLEFLDNMDIQEEKS